MSGIKPRPGKPPHRVPTGPDDLPPPPEASKLPSMLSDGEFLINASKYAREASLMAFEMIGGVGVLAEWAGENKSDFYTKIFTKLIQKEVAVTQKDDIESLLKRIDQHSQNDLEDSMTIDAEFDMVEGVYDSDK